MQKKKFHHSCEDNRTVTDEELRVLQTWSDLSEEQAGGEKRRRDLQCGENGKYPPPFYCSLLQKIRLHEDHSQAGQKETLSLSLITTTCSPSLLSRGAQ